MSILIVDEALAVGDAVFANRCVRKFEELRERKITVLFVSQIGLLVYPSTTIAEVGTVTLLVVGGMVSLVWHGGRDLGNSDEFCIEKEQQLIVVVIFRYMVYRAAGSGQGQPGVTGSRWQQWVKGRQSGR